MRALRAVSFVRSRAMPPAGVSSLITHGRLRPALPCGGRSKHTCQILRVDPVRDQTSSPPIGSRSSCYRSVAITGISRHYGDISSRSGARSCQTAQTGLCVPVQERMTDRDRPSRSDRPLSTLKSGRFGARASDDRQLHRSVIQDAPVSRQAITRLLAPGKIDQPDSPSGSRDKVRSGRRVGRDTPAPAPGTASTQTPLDPEPASPTPSEATLHVASAAELGAIVRQHRTQLGFSQQRLADLAGTGRRFVSELESGKPSLEFDRVVLCCAALGIDLFARARR